MKYPLTDEAKQAARELVHAWNEDRSNRQCWAIVEFTGISSKLHCLVDGPPITLSISRAIMEELAEYGLVRKSDRRWILLQELRNAVESDFEVSEYFLNRITVKVVVDVEQTLGEEFLAANAELRDALNALREATEADKQSKLGRVISELGRCLGHGANTATIISALRALIGA